MSLKKVVSVLKADESVEKKKGYGVGCDFGFANFAVFVDSYGNVTKIPGSYVDEICKPAVFEGNCSLLDTRRLWTGFMSLQSVTKAMNAFIAVPTAASGRA